MSPWRNIKFDDFVRLKRGYDLPNQLVEAGPYPVVASTSIKTYHKAAKVKGPGVVTGRSGSLGGVQFIRGSFWPLNTTLYVKNFKGNDPRFVSYFLQLMHLEGFNAGAGVPTLNQNHLHSLGIVVPEKPTQLKIAAVLSAYDDFIDVNRERIALLERMAEQLYREWFVRFRFPGHEQSKFENGAPTDWEPGRFSDLCTLQRGFDLPDSQISPGEYPVVASTSIKAYHNVYKVEPPVVTTGRSGSLGEVLWVNAKAWPLNTSLFVNDFRGNSPFFVFHTLRAMHLENFNSGAGVPTLNRNHLSSLPINIPPQTLQELFSAQVSPLQELKENLERATEELSRTRDLLLPRLISGKLRIDDLDIQFPPSMQDAAA